MLRTLIVENLENLIGGGVVSGKVFVHGPRGHWPCFL